MKFKIFLFSFVLCFLWLSVLVRPEEKNCTEETEKDRKDIVVFRVKIAGDQYYQTRNQNWRKDSSDEIAVIKSDGWKNDLTDLIGCVNRKFEEQGIRVKLEISGILNWQTEEEITTINESLDDFIKKISLEDYDIVIGLTAKAFSENDKGGLYGPWKYILVKDCSLFVSKEGIMVRENENSWTFAILLHEIGHFFLGISHSDNSESIMHEAWPSGYKEDFLKEEIDLINKNASEIKKTKINAIK